MMRLDERILELADDFRDTLRNHGAAGVKNDIKITIKSSIPKEMVIGGVVNVSFKERILGAKVSKEGISGDILWIDICISTNKYLKIFMHVQKFI